MTADTPSPPSTKPTPAMWRRISMWIFGCIKSQKRTLTVLSLIVGGLALFTTTLSQDSSRYVSSKASSKRLDRQFDEIQETCTTTTRTISLNIQNNLSKSLGLPSKRELQQAESLSKDQKLAVWDRFKNTSFSRCLSQIYCTCLLAMLLRVQMNLIGRYMYLGACSETDYEFADVNEMVFPTDWTQQQYLLSSSHFVEVGVPDLVERVKQAADNVLQKWPLTKKVRDIDVHEIVNEIRSQIEDSAFWYEHLLLPAEKEDIISTEFGSIRYEDSPLCAEDEEEKVVENKTELSFGWESLDSEDRYFSNDEESEKKTLELLMNETRDIFDCAEFREVLAESLNKCFSNFYDMLDISPILPKEQTNDEPTTNANVNKPQSKTQTIARLVLSLGKIIVTMSSDAELELVNESMDSVLGTEKESRNQALESVMASKVLKTLSYQIFTSTE